MKTKISIINGIKIAEIISDSVIISSAEDALDVMAECGSQGADFIIMREDNLVPAFFDLKTRIAGGILQKFSTYRMKLAIVGDFNKYAGKSLKDFIYESNQIGNIIFTSTPEEAKQKIAGKSRQ